MASVVVVGGGAAGLSVAYYLQQAAPQLQITLLEATARLGGKITTVAEHGFVLEGGPDAVVRYKPWALELMQKLGLENRIVGTKPAHPSALIHDGREARPIPAGLQMVIPGDLWALARTPLLSPFGKARALLDLLLPQGTPEDEPFGAFIERRLGRQVWERLVAPLSGGIYGGDPYELSTLAAFPQLKALEEQHGSLIRGAIRQRRARGSREKGQLFASLEGGLGTLVEAIQARLSRIEIRLNTPVTALERTGGWRIHTPQGSLQADALVLATPARTAGELLKPLHPEAAAALRQIPYGASSTVTFAFAKEQLPPRVGHGMLMAAQQGFSVRGFTWIDQKWPGRAPEGYGLVRAYFSGLEASKEELARLALHDLARLWGRAPEPLHTWVFHWPEGLPRYTVGHRERVSQALRAQELPGLFLAGAAYHGVGLPEVIRMGQEVAERVLAFAGKPTGAETALS
ncbi:protoporphyrinogen oxidase [Meiothermus taiwanensis]|uniref:Coproporphyrinogen III oxidase n=2 Tax=Meiothermus taiwanensis TaxID=172827 RepID=A0A399E2X3_9DEIN|nr:protoporphyrinogen oxidase [Meiothermus taiwanensis]AWR86809.1 protoporphyrinogen oxidase [Meiothermus taiwanensis WR-220]KIQ54168.1 protoporphyrinogen oxidase [Meiothermus taiwanensis]KZK15397.1 protoporphyrinogen oxidase [Meiothermus taiwanensis]RIH79017.1 Protoporphyrinogen oxidase [Meiothermus taiwanensis]